MKSKYFFKILTNISLLLSVTGCKKFVEIPPPSTELTGSNVFASNASAASVLTGIYNQMNSFAGGSGGFSVSCGLSADELQGTIGSSLNSQLAPYYQNALTSNTGSGGWGLYNYIEQENAAIEGLTASTTLTTAVQQELIGETKFLRAFDYFYLVNLFGDVPLILSSNYTTSQLAARTPQTQVYQQIVADLKAAQSLLSQNYLMSDAETAYASVATAERVRPNYYAATALLARVYLYQGDWADAVTQSTTVINSTSYYSLPALNNAFLRSSLGNGNSEAIWQLQPSGGYVTPDGAYFIMTAAPPSNAVWLNNNLVNAFETGDQRKANWIGSLTSGGQTYYYAYKYKIKTLTGTSLANITEYTMVLRLGEQYLIRAEAEANNGDITSATVDLNKIRTRAGLQNTTANDKTSMLAAILHERQVELFTEWGHRWLDLKRTGNVNAVMSIVTPQKGGTWNPNWALWPVSLNDIKLNPNLSQNPGY
jgi:hypothetical protein